MIKVEVNHKEIIKPSSPTPHHLRHLCLSLFDQIMLELHMPQVLFYSSSSDEHSLVAEKSELLKKSLSEALTIFYPFAGEFKNNVSINCDDRGALFLEAQVNCPIQLIPTPIRSKQAQVGHLANVFECGGLAIGVSISHKVAHALANSKFIESWAEIARCTASTTDHHVVSTSYRIWCCSYFLPTIRIFKKTSLTLPFIDNVIGRRLVFDASKIAALKAKAATVSALIWKSALEASRSNLGFARPSIWRSSVNLRKILAQPFAENLQGNFVKSVEEFKVKYANEIRGEEVVQFLKEHSELVQKDDMDNYICTSLCRFPFGSADFGWGKASCIRIPWNEDFKNRMLLLDASDGIGIDAYITLKKEDMVMIETNEDLLAYASLH
ncbi:BAHD acyltransferase [Pyrus ussuriensis x Pyrus communis]|uniref:BAHD acyltransferase n=1 Tax=Pyrus ussuriensis x Pyrus communis TaxID=2448454 RepID=A0A5N5FX56_9ROSA|nr:BAHD acyltransferase [Pyrus ussuriensis x Pyrus communis]